MINCSDISAAELRYSFSIAWCAANCRFRSRVGWYGWQWKEAIGSVGDADQRIFDSGRCAEIGTGRGGCIGNEHKIAFGENKDSIIVSRKWLSSDHKNNGELAATSSSSSICFAKRAKGTPSCWRSWRTSTTSSGGLSRLAEFDVWSVWNLIIMLDNLLSKKIM